MTSVGGAAEESPSTVQMEQPSGAAISRQLRLHRQKFKTRFMMSETEPITSKDHQIVFVRRPIARSLQLSETIEHSRDNPLQVKISFDLGSAYRCNMTKVTQNFELQSKHAPKLISSLNKEARPETLVEEIETHQVGRWGTGPKQVGREHISLPTTQERKFLSDLKVRSTNKTDLAFQPASFDFLKRELPQTRFSDAAERILSLAEESLDEDEHVLETFSRNAQYKTSKRRMTRMTKNPMIISEEEERNSNGTSEHARSSVNSDTPKTFRDARRKGTRMVRPLRTEDNSTGDLAVLFKDQFNQDLREKIILDIKQARQSRPSIDLGVLAQDQMWMKLGSSQEMRVHSTKPFQLKSKIHIRSSGAIRELSSGNLALAGDRPHSAKKKVVFAKNKMVLLFEKDF